VSKATVPGGSTRLAAVIGSPVRHSLSPAIHNAAFAAAGADWVYVALEVVAGRGAAALEAMKTLGIGGFSVTMPLKEEIADAVDVIDPAAASLRSVNTVVVLDDGRLSGYSTDGSGFVSSLRSDAGFDPENARVVVVGAGAAARAVIDALARTGAADIAVVNRTPERAVEAVGLAGAVGRPGRPSDIAAADLVINATSMGMGADPLDPAAVPFPLDGLADGTLVADLVYHPLETALLTAARHRGARTLDGLGMLVHQAAIQQELWTGVRPDVAVMRVAAEAELAARASSPVAPTSPG
jgi:shikimate dehydrogenase